MPRATTASGKSASASAKRRPTSFCREPLSTKSNCREVEILANGNSAQLLEKLKSYSPEELRCESLSLRGNFRGLGHILKKSHA